jgi:hypothetical protein
MQSFPEFVLFPVTLANFLHRFDGELRLSFRIEVTKIRRIECAPWDILPRYSTSFGPESVFPCPERILWSLASGCYEWPCA